MRTGTNTASAIRVAADDPKLDALLPGYAVAKLREEIEMVRGLCPPLDLEAYREGHLTPVFFGSAVNNFGVKELLTGVAELAPPPRAQPSLERPVQPTEPTRWPLRTRSPTLTRDGCSMCR